jgi:hypothetical protein
MARNGRPDVKKPGDQHDHHSEQDSYESYLGATPDKIDTFSYQRLKERGHVSLCDPVITILSNGHPALGGYA